MDEVSPMIYGQHTEFVDSHISGMWAEMVKNRCFEDDYPPKVPPNYYFNDITDRPWQPWGKTVRWDMTPASMTMDPKDISQYWIDKAVHEYTRFTSFYRGFRTYHIAVPEHRIDERWGEGESGVMQTGMVIEKGKRYHLRLFLKQKGISGPIKVSLVKDLMCIYQFYYAKAEFTNVGETWTCCEADLTPSESSDDAALLIHFASAGELWIDNVSLMPEDNVSGWRRDVVEATRKLNPGIIRLGGCFNDSYHWRQGVGPRDLRMPFQNQIWGRLEENDVGTIEFIEFCRLVNAEPMICVNVLSGSADEAAEWVEYCNAPADAGLGRLRAKHGYPEPLNVRYWQIGNESYRKYSKDEFADVCVEYSEAMKSVDESIKIIAPHTRSYDDQDLDEMLDKCAEYVDFVDTRTAKDSVFARIEEIIKKHGKGRKIGIASTEWRGTFVDKPPVKFLARATFATLGYALGVAMGLNAFERHAEYVKIGNHNGLVNQWYANSIQTNPKGLFVSATGRILEMYANNHGKIPLMVETETDTLDLSATLDEESKLLCLRAVNASSESIDSEICVDKLALDGKAKSICVRGNSLNDFNDFDFPNKIRIIEDEMEFGDELNYKFPPYSAVTLLMGLS
ncbi:MAG: alpha-L-arabinofuranosidase C-terminal domain-containing protein [Nitrososphaerota archaeon]